MGLWCTPLQRYSQNYSSFFLFCFYFVCLNYLFSSLRVQPSVAGFKPWDTVFRGILRHSILRTNFRSSHRRCSVKKVFLEISRNSQEKENLEQVFSCEFYEISKNTLFYRAPPVAASVTCKNLRKNSLFSEEVLTEVIF